MAVKFEYMVLIPATTNDILVKRLNNLGELGWEFVCFLKGDEILIKRKIGA